MNWKKIVLAVAVIVIFGAVSVGGSLAFLTASEVARNVITMGNIDVALLEKTAEGFDFVNNQTVLPGAAVSKVVTLENIGGNDCWVRMSVSRVIALKGEGTPDLSMLDIDFDTEHWTEKDGYFYYNELLKAGESTLPLFTQVVFSADMGEIYTDATVEVTVQAQAVQADNNGETVLDALGWPEVQ